MNRLPHVTIRAKHGGWVALCQACAWTHWRLDRPAVDQAALHHRATCTQKRGT